MARIEDYLPGGEKDPNRQGGDLLDNSINDAAAQQQARLNDGTPAVDWETRYKELEKLNSRQAQTLGEQRKLIDEYILSNPTPSTSQQPPEAPQPITVDDLYEDPNAAIQRAVESHPGNSGST